MQMHLNKFSPAELAKSSIFQKASLVKSMDLTDKDSLLQFLLLFNYPFKEIHSAFVNHFSFPEGGYDLLKILPFAECSCNCGRRVSPKGKLINNRLKMEQEILSQIEKRWGKEKEHKKLTIVSIGAGGCLQEWILLSKLVLMGFKKVKIHLADPVFKRDITKIKTFLPEFFAQFKDLEFEFDFHDSLEEFSKKNVEADVLMAIDWDVKPIDNESKVPIKVSHQGFSYVNKQEPNWINSAPKQFSTQTT